MGQERGEEGRQEPAGSAGASSGRRRDEAPARRRSFGERRRSSGHAGVKRDDRLVVDQGWTSVVVLHLGTYMSCVISAVPIRQPRTSVHGLPVWNSSHAAVTL